MGYENNHGHPSKTRSATVKALWADPEWRAQTIAKRRKSLAKAWTPERRRRQSEMAKNLNKTMPKAIRAANGRKISAKAIERYKDPVKRAEWVETLKRGHKTSLTDPIAKGKMMAGMRKRRKDLDRARRVVNEWGLYIEDTATQEDLDDIFAIFL